MVLGILLQEHTFSNQARVCHGALCLTEPRFPKQELVDRARDVEVAQVGEAGLTFGNDSFSLDSLFHRDL